MMTTSVVTVALMRHGGSHLIRPIVSRLGFDIIEPGNFGAPIDVAQGPVIVFLRDPRDRMVSTLRWWRNKPRKAAQLATAGNSDDMQLEYLLDKQGFLTEMLQWAEIWCNWPEGLHIRFESMREQGYITVAIIADHLGLKHDLERNERVFDTVYTKGRTYTGRFSNWRESFGPKSLAYWHQNGGNDLLRMMEYDW